MRWIYAVVGCAAIMAPPLASAQESQESLCNPCVDPPHMMHPRLQDFGSPDAVQVITAEDLRNLGLVSVTDMIMQMSLAVTDETTPDPEEVDVSPDVEDAEGADAPD